MPKVCPNCGEDLPPKARACPECGSDENTGWSEEVHAADLGLPEDNFNYEEFTEREFGAKKSVTGPTGLAWYYVWAAALLILFFIWVIFI
jgi:uncharacterized membrane protein YvbJ